MPQPPVNPHAALPQEATLVRKKIPEQPRRVARIGKIVVDGARATLPITILEDQAGTLVDVAQVEKIIPSNELVGQPEEIEVRIKTRREQVLKEYRAIANAAALEGDEYAF